MQFVTVTYEKEFNLQIIQARSFARFCPIELVTEILVIVNNDGDNMNGTDFFRTTILPEYGPHVSKVRVVSYTHYQKDDLTIPSYIRQQILKIRAAAQSLEETVVTLDSKNFFLRTVGIEDFYSANGKPKCYFEDFSAHMFKSLPPRYNAYFGRSKNLDISRLPTVMTPFILIKSLCRDLICTMEMISEESFERAFLSRIGIQSEFMLYSTFILGSGYEFDDLYCASKRLSFTLWARNYSGTGALAKAFRDAQRSNSIMFGLHVKRIIEFTAEDTESTTQFLRELCILGESEPLCL